MHLSFSNLFEGAHGDAGQGLRFEGESEVRVMSAGDCALIPARTKRRVET
jgi:hypothetical protein